MLGYWTDLQNYYKKMQSDSPVHFDPDHVTFFGHKGVWQIFLHKDAEEVMKNYEAFSSAYMPKTGQALSESINQQDPPNHNFTRKVLTQALTPELITGLIPWMYTTAEQLLSPGITSGKMDFVKDVANPFPSYVINRLLGIPGENNTQVENWINTILEAPDLSNLEAAMAAKQQVQTEMAAFFFELIERRKEKPESDLISSLVTSSDNGKFLSEVEILGTCIALIMAGNETTSGLIANTLYTIVEYPDIFQHLHQKIDEVPAVINEVLRFRSPVQRHYRKAVKDVIVRGKLIKAGDIVAVNLGAANLDPSIFPEPFSFQLHRPNIARIMSFGHGIHYCVGAMTSKIEAKIVIESFLRKAGPFKLNTDGLKMSNSILVSSVQSLPITLI